MIGPASSDGPREAVGYLQVGRSYRSPLLVRQFPTELPFGFLGRVLPTTERIELRLEAHPIPAPHALAMIAGARAVAEAELARTGDGSPVPELENERASAEELGRAVARRAQELWRVGLSLVAVGPNRPRVEAMRTRLGERLAALGFRSRIPRYEVARTLAPPGFSGDESRPVGYWHTLPTDGLASLFPFSDETVIEPRGILLGLALSDASPVFLDRWAHASYSWGIFGTTGSGKSFATALAILRTRWMRPELPTVVLDPLGEYGSLVRALGGEVVRLADPAAGRLNPLDPSTVGNDRAEKAARATAMLRALFPSLRDEEVAALDAAVSRLYRAADRPPTFDGLAAEVGPDAGRLPVLLEVFRSGSLRALNGPTTLRVDAPLVAVDFRGVAPEQLAFHLAYVLDWAYGRLREHPGPQLLVVDEAHLLTANEATAEFLDRVVRHVRHFEAGVVVVSQNPDDFLGRTSGRSLLRNLAATAFLRLPEVSPETRRFFGLTSAEAEWLPKARLPREAGYSESLWRIGELHLPLALVASTPEFELITEHLGGPGAETPPPNPAGRSGSL